MHIIACSAAGDLQLAVWDRGAVQQVQLFIEKLEAVLETEWKHMLVTPRRVTERDITEKAAIPGKGSVLYSIE